MKFIERILVTVGVALILLGLLVDCSLVQHSDRYEGEGENGCGHYGNSRAHWPVWRASIAFGHRNFPASPQNTSIEGCFQLSRKINCENQKGRWLGKEAV